jgi:methyl-accepting chemotaxis protein
LLNVLLVIVGFGLVTLIFISQLNSFPSVAPRTFIPEMVALATITGCYYLNRYISSALSAFIFFTVINIIVLIYIISAENQWVVVDIRTLSGLLTIPVVASGIIIGPAFSFIFAAISVSGLLAVTISRVDPTIPNLENPINAIAQLGVPISLLLVMAGLAWFFDSNFQQLIRQLKAQNRVLDEANQELARQHEVEKMLTKRVNELTAQVSISFNEQNENTSEQLVALLQATTTIEELNQTNESISRLAGQVDLTAQEALKVAEKGTSNVRGGLSSLKVLNERSQAFANSMDELYNQARQIDQIIELITEVAEETNLLALNATIEAAGAREYGRRFASVANEVQRLANRSRDAADQVRQVMDEFRRAIQNSSEVALQGVNDTDNILSNSRQMEFTLEGIVAMVENTATLARQISLSIQQQRGATVQVVDTMRHISSLSNAVARGSEDLMTSLYDLNTAVTRLNEPETNGSGTLNGR